jgi:hypothetical protein
MDKQPQTVRYVKSLPPMSDQGRVVSRELFNHQPDGAPFGPAADESDEGGCQRAGE